MNPHDELWMKFRGDLEKEITEEIRQKLEKENEGMLQKMKEEAEAQAKEKYEEKLEKYIQDSQDGLKEVEESMAKLRSLLAKPDEDADVALLDSEKMWNTPFEENEDLIPPILRPELQDFLRDVANELDPSSFLKLTRANRMLNRLAKEGILSTRLPIKCTTYSHSEDNEWFDDLPLAVVPSYKTTALGFKELALLHSAKYLKAEIECLCIVEFNQGVSHAVGKKVMELLDYIHVQNIQYFNVGATIDIESMLQKYNVDELRVSGFAKLPTSFLLNPLMNRVKDFDLTMYNFRNDDAKKVVEDFLLSTLIPKISVNEMMNPSLVPKLVKLWMSGDRHYKHIYFELEANPTRGLFEELQKDYEIKDLNLDLKGVTQDEFKQIVNCLVPSIYRGSDSALILIREDRQMLKADYSNVDWAILHDMEVDDED